MNPLKTIKTALVALCAAAGIFLAASSSTTGAAEASDKKDAAVTTATAAPEDFVGSETCQSCHEEQFKGFSHTAHSGLAKAGWKNQGCESCHGAGKAHVEAGGDKTKIRTFENETPKQKSEACLQCHSGKEEHNNYRRGEHWRNDVGCTDCHSPHMTAATLGNTITPNFLRKNVPSALQPLGPFPATATDVAPQKMLIKPETQLCMSCHNETKSQFTQPFHHRVLEGAMKCSDCHNAHGGFQAKQTRLAVGADQACFKCHADKQGPFVFEHAPAKIEGCTMCHDTHGSSNPKLLKRTSVAQLCIECHTDAHEKGGAPGTPSFHNLTTARIQNCTTCHSKIHGSNTHKFYFR
jgi:predicted CXXCH cytochrome family protein